MTLESGPTHSRCSPQQAEWEILPGTWPFWAENRSSPWNPQLRVRCSPYLGWGEGRLHPRRSELPPCPWGICRLDPLLYPAAVAGGGGWGEGGSCWSSPPLVGWPKWPCWCPPLSGHTGPDRWHVPALRGPWHWLLRPLGVGGPYLVRLPVPKEVDGAIQAPLDDGPAPGVVSLVAPHLHEAVGVLWLHQVDGAGVVAVLQGLQAVSPGAWGHRCACVTDPPPPMPDLPATSSLPPLPCTPGCTVSGRAPAASPRPAG